MSFPLFQSKLNLIEGKEEEIRKVRMVIGESVVYCAISWQLCFCIFKHLANPFELWLDFWFVDNADSFERILILMCDRLTGYTPSYHGELCISVLYLPGQWSLLCVICLFCHNYFTAVKTNRESYVHSLLLKLYSEFIVRVVLRVHIRWRMLLFLYMMFTETGESKLTNYI